MEPVKTYTHLDRKERLFGIEVMDFLLLALVYAVVFILSTNIIANLCIVSSCSSRLALQRASRRSTP